MNRFNRKLYNRTFFLTLSILGLSFPMQGAYAQEADSVSNELSVDSAEFQFDDGVLCLKGNVVVEHDLGKISANQMIILPEKGQKTIKLNDLTMTDHVIITTKDGGQLTCAYAHLDYQSMAGFFTGDEQQEFVTYTEALNEEAHKSPLTIKSREMSVQIARNEPSSSSSSKTPHNEIRSITADGHVSIDYNEDLAVFADHAEYLRMPGMLTLTSRSPNADCQVKLSNGDYIHSKDIKIDLNEREFVFTDPKGKMDGTHLTSITSNKDKVNIGIEFSAQKLVWNDPAQRLVLDGDVVINQEGFWGLTTDQELELYQHVVEGKNCIKSIRSQGKTVLAYLDQQNEKENRHTLTGFGTLFIDQELFQTQMNSPMDGVGNVIADKQIHFQDSMGEIYADKLFITYEEFEGVTKPKLLSLEGNIRILNQPVGDSTQSEKYLQYALADRVEYTPDTQELRLFAYEDKRVLFIDRLNNMQVSAPALKVKRDQLTHKEIIDGIGNVRFSLLEQEMSQIQKMFPELNRNAG